MTPEQLRQLRQSAKLTQGVAAKILRVSLRTYKRYELGQTPFRKIFYDRLKDHIDKQDALQKTVSSASRAKEINQANCPQHPAKKLSCRRTETATLYHGDCFEAMKYLPDHSINLIVSSPPFGQKNSIWHSLLPLDLLWQEYARLLKPKGAVILLASQPCTWQLCASNPEWFKYELIWKKPNGTNPMAVKRQPFKNHENILVFYDKQPTYNPQMVEGGQPYSGFDDPNKSIGEAYGHKNTSKHRDNPDGTRYPKSVQEFEQERGLHPLQKPVALMEWLIKSYSNENDTVLDNTMGSGTTGVACQKAKRQFIGIELDQQYFDVAVKRMTML